MSFGVIRLTRDVVRGNPLTSVALLVLTLMARPSRPNQEGEASPPPSPKIVARKGSMQTIGLTLLLISMPIYVLAMLSSTTETSSILPTNFIPDDNIAHDDIAPGASAQLLYWASDQFTLTTLVASTALYVDLGIRSIHPSDVGGIYGPIRRWVEMQRRLSGVGNVLHGSDGIRSGSPSGGGSGGACYWC